MNLFNLISAIIGGIIIGGFCGSLSLIFGIYYKKLWIGIIGLCISIGFGVLMTVVFYLPAFLSLIPNAAFVLLIFLLSKSK